MGNGSTNEREGTTVTLPKKKWRTEGRRVAEAEEGEAEKAEKPKEGNRYCTYRSKFFADHAP